MRLVKKGVALLAKMVLAAALVYLLVRRGDLDFRLIAGIDWTSRVAGVVILGGGSVLVGLLLLAWRLILLLNHLGVRVSFRRMLAVTMFCSLSGAVLPGLVGGDVVKAVLLFGDTAGRRSRAVGAVIVDRAIGVYALLLLGTAALAAAWATGRVLSIPLWIQFVVPMGVLALTAAAAVTRWASLARFRVAARLYQRLPARPRNVAGVMRDCLHDPAVMGKCVMLAVLNHSLVVVSFVTAAIVLGLDVPLWTHFVISPAAMVMNMVPLTPGGIGVAEGAFAFLYAQAGLDNGATVGLVGRMIQYLVFAAGGGVSLLFIRWRHVRTAERMAEDKE